MYFCKSYKFRVFDMFLSFRLYKYASVGFTAFGLYLLAKHAFQYIMDRRCQWEMRKR